MAQNNNYDINIPPPDYEIWRNIIGFEGTYQISSFGRVRALDRLELRKTRHSDELAIFNINGGIRSVYVSTTGYIFCGLSKGGISKHFSIHRLVAIHFVPNPNNYKVINHKDHNRLNPIWSNLEWCTQKMNINHAINNNRMLVGSKNGQSKLKEEDVYLIRRMLNNGVSQSVIAKKFNVDQSSISYINTNKKWRHIL